MIAGVINEVDRSGAGHDVNGGSKNDDSGDNNDTYEVVLEMEPELVEVHLGSLDDSDRHKRDQTESQEVCDKIMIPEFYVLQVYAL